MGDIIWIARIEEEKIMPRTGRNIYKRKDGRWEGRYLRDRDVNGKIIYGYVYSKTCAGVKDQLASALEKPPKKALSAGIVSETADQWLSVMALRVKPSTLVSYEAVVRLHILPQLGQVALAKLTAVAISEFALGKLQNGRKDGGELAPKTVRDILSVLKGILDFAVSEKLIENSVAITYPKHCQKSMRVFSRSEQSELERVLLENITIYKIGILLCLYTGLRIGEVCGLQWKDFSPGFDKLSIRRSVRRIAVKGENSKTRLVIDIPKSKSSVRDIPIPNFLSSMLSNFPRKGDTYFLSTFENHLMEPRTMQNHFKRIIKAAGILDANFHCLRHTFSTRCIEANVDVKSLSELLGHASVNITLNRYVHSSFEQKRESISKLEQHLGL